jgi:hypothetical protein
MRRIATKSVYVVCSLIGMNASLLVAQERPAPAQKPDPVRIARLIRDLGSPSYTKRETATEALATIGAAGRERLESALQSSDPEVRLRAARLLKQLNVERLWQGSPVKLVANSMKASDAVKALGKQTENEVAVGDQYGTFQESDVTFDRTEGQFWPIVDELCRQSGNRVRPRYGSSRPGLVFVSGDCGDYPVTYAGPVRAQITAAKRVFIEEYDYEDTTSETTHTFQFTMLLSWENRFRVVAHQTHLDVAEAVADVPARIFGHETTDGGWQVVENSVQQFSTTMRLQPPPQSATALKRLTLAWELIAVGEPANLAIEDFADDTVHRQEDLSLHIQKMEQVSETRHEMVIAISRDLVVPEPEEILFLENEFALFDADGRPFELRGQSRLGISNGVAKMKLTFVAPTANIHPTQFVLTYPRIRDRRAVPITFENVPLPVARPD